MATKGHSWRNLVRPRVPPKLSTCTKKQQRAERGRALPRNELKTPSRPFHWAEASGLCSKPNELDILIASESVLDILTSTLTGQEEVAVTVADAAFWKKGCSSLGFRYGGRSRPFTTPIHVSAQGMLTWKLVPPPTVLSTQMRPLWASTIPLQIASPVPR